MNKAKNNSRRQKRRRMRLLRQIAVALGALALIGIAVVCVLMFSKEDAAPLMHPYQAEAVEVEAPSATLSNSLPKPFADGLCISAESDPLDTNIFSIVAAVYNRTTGEVVYSEKADKHMPQASITKLMTFYLALEYGNLNDTVTVSDEWLADLDEDSSLCGIKDGDQITLEQLLYGLMLPSGNDAANAIAYHISGSEEAFVKLMNETALLLGMTDSHFMNAHGLHHDDHYTSGYDIYLLFNRLLDYEVFRQVIETQEYTAAYTNNGMPVVKSWKRSIAYFTGEREMPETLTGIGGKTGTTPEALCCLTYAFSDEVGDEYIAVILRIGNKERLYNCMDILLSKVAN